MTQPAAGWYADPAGGQSERWWDGARWSDSTRPLPPAAGGVSGGAAAYPAEPAYSAPQPYGRPFYPQAAGAGQQPNATLFRRNRYTAYTVLVGVAYVLLASVAHFVLIGVLPILFTVRAFRGKEPLAPVAAVVAALAVVFSILLLA